MYNSYYFIGIGGIGMSAIARYFHTQGFAVAGYDKTPSPLTRALEQEGIAVHYDDDPGAIPQDTEHTFVIYTPAIPDDLAELQYVRSHGYTVCKRSRALGEIARGKTCLAVGLFATNSSDFTIEPVDTDGSSYLMDLKGSIAEGKWPGSTN